jgi:tetratricopeptide (TPR) repeat protein
MSTRPTGTEIAQSLIKEMGRESLLAYFKKRLLLGKELPSRSQLLAAFAQLAGPDAKDQLIFIARDLTESPNTRVAAVTALGRLAKESNEASRRSELVEVLKKLLDDNPIELRSAVATQLAGLQATVATELLQKLLEEDKLDVLAREEVQKFLATTGMPAATLPKHSLVGRRQELIALHDAFRNSQIVALVGIGGVGKSALAASFVETARYDVKVWRSCQYSIDPADLAKSLLLQIEEQINPNAPHVGKELEQHFDWARIKNHLVNLLTDHSALIVLDDYEDQHEENEFIDLLNRLVEALPGIHCLVVGRVIPSMLTDTVISLKGLSLDESHEVVRIAAEHAKIFLDSDTRENIVKLSEGNALLLNLYTSALNQGLSIEEVLASGRDRVIHSIVSRSVQNLTPLQRRTVELLSQFDEPISTNDREIAELFVQEGVSSLSECLASLTRRSFVVSDDRGSIALHNLVRELIRDRTDKRTTIRVNRSLGTLYKKRGSLLRAANHFVRGEVIEQAVHLLDEHLVDIVNQGHVVSALAILDSISVPNNLQPKARMQFFTSLGFFSRFQGKHQRALESYQRVLDVARGIGDRREESLALSLLGRVYVDTGSVSTAIECYEQRLAISREIGDRRMEGVALRSLGRIYADAGNRNKAIEYYERSLSIAREINDRSGEAAAMGNLGQVYADLGATDRAIECYSQRLETMREIGNRRGESAALGSLGRVYAELGAIEKAVYCHEQRLAIAREIGDRRVEGVALGNIGRIHLDMGEIQKAIVCYETRLQIAREIGDPRGEGAALNSLGMAHFKSGTFERAIECYERRLAIARVINDQKAEGAALGSLGKVYAELHNYDNAIRCNEMRLQIARQIRDLKGEVGALASLGQIHAELGNSDRATEYYEKELLVAREIGDTRAEASAITALGAVYAEMGHLPRAIDLYNQALEVARISGDNLGQVRITSALGNTYLMFDETSQAVDLFEAQLQAARKGGDRRGEGAGLFNISLAHEKMRNLKAAILYAEQALKIFEKINDTKTGTVREKLASWRGELGTESV